MFVLRSAVAFLEISFNVWIGSVAVRNFVQLLVIGI